MNHRTLSIGLLACSAVFAQATFAAKAGAPATQVLRDKQGHLASVLLPDGRNVSISRDTAGIPKSYELRTAIGPAGGASITLPPSLQLQNQSPAALAAWDAGFLAFWEGIGRELKATRNTPANSAAKPDAQPERCAAVAEAGNTECSRKFGDTAASLAACRSGVEASRLKCAPAAGGTPG